MHLLQKVIKNMVHYGRIWLLMTIESSANYLYDVKLAASVSMTDTLDSNCCYN